MVHPVAAQMALDEARRRLDIQLDTIESIRSRGLAVLGVAGLVGSMAGLPEAAWQTAIIVALSAAAIAALVALLRDRKLRGPVNPLDILDKPEWASATDATQMISSLARSLATRHDEQTQTIASLLKAYRGLLGLSLLLILMFIAWGGTSS